jgi:single-stranded DNA-binding protein
MKMNDLNSVIVEGFVNSEPETTKQGGYDLCMFSVESARFFKTDDAIEKEVSTFWIEAWSKLAPVCQKDCTAGRVLRIVGRLAERQGKVVVIAEHVEFKGK